MRLSSLAGEPVSPDPEIAGLTADSRMVKQGFLFAAIPGFSQDGSKFVPQAEKNGAAAILAPPGVASTLPVIHDREPRRRFAKMAARFFPDQPKFMAGVTGTNGKSSTVVFAEQLWAMLGRRAGSIGTLGATGAGYSRKLEHTTPEPALLHEVLSEMAGAGVEAAAMEVSSHAIAQARADGVKFSCAAFTNITQDHLDFHNSFEEYFSAKQRLFSELAPADGTAIVNCAGAGADRIIEDARKRGMRVIETGPGAKDLCCERADPTPDGLSLKVVADGEDFEIVLPLVGAFQAQNALLAAGIVVASGVAPRDVLPLLARLKGAPGRMQRVGEIAGAGVYVDYAHTPDAIETAIQAIAPHTKGKVIALIGAGGDRDRSKRALMGKAAERADTIIVTDDNPRTEDASEIRKAVMKGAPGAREISDRREAIETGVSLLGAGDVFLIMGKGHETGQLVGKTVLPFDDAHEAALAIAKIGKELGR